MNTKQENIIAELDYLFQEGVMIRDREELKKTIIQLAEEDLINRDEVKEIVNYCEYNKMFYKDPISQQTTKTTEWKAYKEFGNYFRLYKGLLQGCPMLANGDMENEESRFLVEDIEEEDEKRIEEIKKELLKL